MMQTPDEKLLFILVQETLIVWRNTLRDPVISMADDEGRKIPRFGLVGLVKGTIDMVSIRDGILLSG